jgi:NAD(P)-dependent dehydrogenase (short-subunit alcohol dehydrogenase family)
LPSVLISGANRGIGLELARQYAAEGWTVHATARNPEDAVAVRAFGDNVRTHRLDVVDAASIAALADSLAGVPIDVLIANAGLPGDTTPLEEIERAELLRVMEVNSFAPLALATALLPNLEAGQMKIAAAMSSLMSSIGSNDWGTQSVYRASKTALNVIWASLATEWRDRGIACVLLRPGIVKTRMTGFTGLEPEESVSGMRRVLAGITFADSGRLIGYDGKDVPW